MYTEMRAYEQQCRELERYQNRNRARARKLVKNKRASAEKKGVPFELDEVFLTELLNAAETPNRCPILNIDFEWDGPGLKDGSPSLDRIVPHLGYIRGNVAVISNRANRIKHEATLSELKAIVAYVEEHTKPKIS